MVRWRLSPTSSMSVVRTQRCTSHSRRPIGWGWPCRYGVSGCMPAVVNSTSSVGDITEWPSISSWSLSSMYWRKRSRPRRGSRSSGSPVGRAPVWPGEMGRGRGEHWWAGHCRHRLVEHGGQGGADGAELVGVEGGHRDPDVPALGVEELAGEHHDPVHRGQAQRRGPTGRRWRRAGRRRRRRGGARRSRAGRAGRSSRCRRRRGRRCRGARAARPRGLRARRAPRRGSGTPTGAGTPARTAPSAAGQAWPARRCCAGRRRGCRPPCDRGT